jgi:hypothetical protein
MPPRFNPRRRPRLIPNLPGLGFAESLGFDAAGLASGPWALREPPLSPVEGATAIPANRFPVNTTWDPGALADRDYGQRTKWDALVIAGLVTPGIATVTARRNTRLQKNESPGTDGETLNMLGLRAAEIQVTIRLLTQGDLDAWEVLVPSLQATPGKPRPDPVSVYHPALDMLNIHALYVEDLGIPEARTPGGALEVKISFVEHLPTKAAPGPLKVDDPAKIDLGKRPRAQTFVEKKPSETQHAADPPRRTRRY